MPRSGLVGKQQVLAVVLFNALVALADLDHDRGHARRGRAGEDVRQGAALFKLTQREAGVPNEFQALVRITIERAAQPKTIPILWQHPREPSVLLTGSGRSGRQLWW